LIVTARQVAVYAFAGPVDMRKSFNTLSALVKSEMRHDVLTGSLYLLVSKNRERAKVLESSVCIDHHYETRPNENLTGVRVGSPGRCCTFW
jgi:hypothetical protein